MLCLGHGWTGAAAAHCIVPTACFHHIVFTPFIHWLSCANAFSVSCCFSLALLHKKKKQKPKPATTFSLVHILLSLALFIALRHWLPLNRNLLRVAATVVAVAAPADLALSFFWCESFASVARLYWVSYKKSERKVTRIIDRQVNGEYEFAIHCKQEDSPICWRLIYLFFIFLLPKTNIKRKRQQQQQQMRQRRRHWVSEMEMNIENENGTLARFVVAFVFVHVYLCVLFVCVCVCQTI